MSGITVEDVRVWPYSVSLLVKVSAFLGTLHWPAGAVDLGVGGVSFVELLILYELWAGERLCLENAVPRHRRVGRPISVSAVPFGPGIDIWRSCRFFGAIIRALRLLPGGLGRFLPGGIGVSLFFPHSHDSPRKTCTFQGRGVSNLTKIPRKDPQREKKSENGSGREKKAENFGPPTLRPPSGPPPFGAPPHTPRHEHKPRHTHSHEHRPTAIALSGENGFVCVGRPHPPGPLPPPKPTRSTPSRAAPLPQTHGMKVVWDEKWGRDCIWPNRIWPTPHLAKVDSPHLANLIWPNLGNFC